MKQLDIIIPVKNEAGSIKELVERIDKSLTSAEISYKLIFIDDHSDDATVQEINKLAFTYPVICQIKKGKPGKAYSILEGARLATSPSLAMIDGDCQYPPEALPEMLTLLENHGVVVANRKNQRTSFLRKIGSKLNVLIFERLLHGFKVDTQSGLKVFKKEVVDNLSEKDVYGWTIDMPLLRTALELGYSVGCVDIDFVERKAGKSKINFVKAGAEIAVNSLKLKLRRRKVYQLAGVSPDSPLGAGVAHRGYRFITHTYLPHEKSALSTFYPWQKAVLLFLLATLSIGLFLDPKTTAISVIGLLTFIYFLDFLFNLYVILKSLHFPPEIAINDEELAGLDNNDLPFYSILCPLYKEAEILPQFISAIENLDWPKEKLDALLLLEEDDKATIDAARNLNLPSHFRILVVPHSLPKTKPKACNFGLAHAKGEFVVIYDAEDKPEASQLKKAYLAFQGSNEKVVCLQCKLNYYNNDQNLLTRLFTAEYSLWFDLILPGLQSVEATIPLGGTSNHFRTEKLKSLHGWDAFNVAEDCDLGTRLFKEGYKTAILDSTTLEEANSRLGSWLKQRSRWIKGYLQTYLVHMRNPLSFIKTHGVHAFIFQLVIGARMVFILINPILWIATISYFTLYKFVGPTIEELYPMAIFYLASFCLVFGNFMYLYNYMIGCLKRRSWSEVKYVYLVPFYWVATSVAAVIAFYQLFTKPHYWEKTQHGLHFAKEVKRSKLKVKGLPFGIKPAYAGGFVLIAASVFANFTNFLYNAYLGRSLPLENFATISLVTSIWALASIVFGSIGRTVTHKIAFLLGKDGLSTRGFWSKTVSEVTLVSFFATAAWLISIPYLSQFFRVDNFLPLLLFTPIWTFGFVGSVNSGYINGNLKFFQIALLSAIEAVTKLGAAIFFVEVGFTNFIYATIPLSLLASYLLSWVFVARLKKHSIEKSEISAVATKFPKGFFITSILGGASTVVFLSLDVVLAKHYLTPVAAGQYALLSLSGKIIYFLGGLFSQFINPVISKKLGENKNSIDVFYKLLTISAIFSAIGYIFIGVLGYEIVPLLFGEKARAIVEILPIYGLAMFVFSVSGGFIIYHQIKKHYIFPVTSFLFSLILVYGIVMNHADFTQVATVVSIVSFMQFLTVVFIHLSYDKLSTLARNIGDFLGLFESYKGSEPADQGIRILILNWRDSKHVWGGGAEVYVEELAKNWVKEGHKVTLFCGNDGNCKRNEVIDGIRVVRRGGFYMVYFWAFLYYIFRFRGKFDVVIDCENGIPFFTPLYARVPRVLLIHHVHQDVFRNHLVFPLSFFAMFLEARLMPFLYRKTQVVTISESSKKAIVNKNLTRRKRIEIVNPGVDLDLFRKTKKTISPTFTYVGRLKHYKNVDVAIRAFLQVLRIYQEARFLIVGKGEEETNLKNLAKELGIEKYVIFAGFVSEKKKSQLLAQSWAAIQPSSFEGWGITVIEANACATPVIASRIDGLSDSVRDGSTGLLVPVKDEKVLAKAMEGMITDKKYRRELSKNAYQWSKNFSWEKSAREFLKIIFKVLEPNREVIFTRRIAIAEN